ncbi:EpaQ family protein [Enterococcus sp. DIV0756]|uniref:EpaQ family protein n=1 Tax=Enterococcus sp. DIV0756 TaxID=2774636 RepID=UPI003F208497
MEKISNRIGQWLLLISIAASFSIWFFGTKTFLTGIFYFQANQLLFGTIVIILILNFKKFLLEDYVILGYAFIVGVYSFITSGEKYIDTPELNLVLPSIILLILCYKVCRFNKIELTFLSSLLVVIIIVMSVKTLIGLSRIITLDRIIAFDNSLRELWINVNTIGAALTFGVMLLTILLKSSKYVLLRYSVVVFYLIGLILTWACQSKTPLMILFLFIILDNLIPKFIFQRFKIWLAFIPMVFIGMPFIAHFFADSVKYDLFTGREDIWKRFFEVWLTKDEFIYTGLGVYVDPVKQLSIHDSYLFTLSNYGIIGYILLFGFLTFLIILVWFNHGKELSKMQVSCMLAFFVLTIYASMEDTLLVAPWMPLIYIFIGLALSERSIRKDIVKTTLKDPERRTESRINKYY